MQKNPLGMNARAKKILAVVAIPVFLLAVLAGILLVMRRPEPPIQIVGNVSDREVADIRAALRHKINHAILPNFTVKSLRAAPGRLLERVTTPSPKIWRIEARTHGFAAVLSHAPTNTMGEKYVFWCTFRGTNQWWVGDYYGLTDYKTNAPDVAN